jgi:hypothetical protein
VEHLLKNFVETQWVIGPDFLWETETTWSKSNNDFSISSNDPEVRRSVAVCATSSISNLGMEHLISHFSDWNKLKENNSMVCQCEEKL